MTDTRMPPPPLWFVEPPCPMCHETTFLEDGVLYCPDCEAFWSLENYLSNDEPEAGRWDEPDQPQCLHREPRVSFGWSLARQRSYEVTVSQRCLYVSGHEGRHFLGDETSSQVACGVG